MIVIDAAALTDFVVDRRGAVAAVDQEIGDRGHEPLHSPEVVEPETLNALRSMSFRAVISARRATRAVTDLDRIRLIRYPHELSDRECGSCATGSAPPTPHKSR